MRTISQASASDAFGCIAAYAECLFEDVFGGHEIEAHFEHRRPDARGLNRPYELGELMSLH